MWKVVAEGKGVGGLERLQDYEEQMAEGQKGKLLLSLRAPLPDYAVEQLRAKMVEAGVLDASVVTCGNDLVMEFRKGAPWLLIIAGIVLGLIVLSILIVAWQFYKEVTEIVPKGIVIAGVIVGVILLGLLAYWFYKNKLKGEE